MPVCNGCGGVFDWGFDGERWVTLEPIATHGDLDRTFVDEDGSLRADHRDRHPGGRSVNVTRLERKVLRDDAPSEEGPHRVAARARRAIEPQHG